MTLVAGAITVWVDLDGVPEGLLWEGLHYRVTDTPTPLDFDLNAVTHLPVLPAGWRFQGTDDGGDSLIFDVVSFDGDGREWRVLHTYQ